MSGEVDSDGQVPQGWFDLSQLPENFAEEENALPASWRRGGVSGGGGRREGGLTWVRASDCARLRRGKLREPHELGSLLLAMYPGFRCATALALAGIIPRWATPMPAKHLFHRMLHGRRCGALHNTPDTRPRTGLDRLASKATWAPAVCRNSLPKAVAGSDREDNWSGTELERVAVCDIDGRETRLEQRQARSTHLVSVGDIVRHYRILVIGASGRGWRGVEADTSSDAPPSSVSASQALCTAESAS